MILFIYLLTYDAYGWFEVTFNRVWLSVYPIAVFIAGYLLPKIKIGNDMEL
jgi:hypothetical protein